MTGVKHHRQENRFRNRNNLMFQFSASVLLIFLIVDSNTESIESGLDKVAPSGVSLDGEPVSDTRAQEVAQFAIGELRGVCRYCDDAYRAGYEAMTLKQLWSAEAKNLTVLRGRMFILNVTLQTPVPVKGRSEDSMVLAVFQMEDGAYAAVSTQRSPFMDN
uniref:Uncharacterized protein n=1 Tax=Tetraselmis sp. GSL018 TaxID=582737 RepID=A0A061RGR7_9CHLO